MPAKILIGRKLKFVIERLLPSKADVINLF